jgi:ATP-dependent Clp protease protease subunit
VHGDVSEGVIAGVIAQLIHLASTSAAPIHLVISTYGGSVDEMFSLYDAIKFLPCPVYTVGLGKVMSAGVVLLASGAKGKRLIGASSRIMMHPISTGIFGNVFELENQTAEARRMQELMVKLLQRETKMTRKRIEQAIMKPMLDYYITPEQAIADGIVDRVIGAPTKV